MKKKKKIDQLDYYYTVIVHIFNASDSDEYISNESNYLLL